MTSDGGLSALIGRLLDPETSRSSVFPKLENSEEKTVTNSFLSTFFAEQIFTDMAEGTSWTE